MLIANGIIIFVKKKLFLPILFALLINIFTGCGGNNNKEYVMRWVDERTSDGRLNGHWVKVYPDGKEIHLVSPFKKGFVKDKPSIYRDQ